MASMNYCNCPNCRTDNCPNVESPAEIAENANDTFVMGDIIRLRKVEDAQREEIEKLRAALMKIGECAGRNILVEAPYGNQVRLDEALQQIHDAALSALTKPQPSQI